MSGKRPASYAIDQKTLQPIPQQQDNNDQSNNSQKPPIERQIFKVKSEGDSVKKTDDPKDQSKGLLFANLFNNNNGVGLFNNKGLFSTMKNNASDNNKEEKVAIDLASPTLFTGNGNIFPKPQPKETPSFFQTVAPSLFQNGGNNSLFQNGGNNSLFQNGAKDSSSLFQNAGSSIFGFGNNNNKLPPVRAGEQEDEGDSQQLEKAQEMKIDKSKSKSTYQYKQQMKVLFTTQAKKYKKNDGDLVQNVEVIVQFKEQAKIAVLVVRLTATKHSILNGIIVKEKCQIRFLNKKEQNVELFVLCVQQGKPASKEKIKLQFESSEVGKKFYETISNIADHDNNDVEKQKKQEQQAKEGQQKVEQKQSKQKKQ